MLGGILLDFEMKKKTTTKKNLAFFHMKAHAQNSSIDSFSAYTPDVHQTRMKIKFSLEKRPGIETGIENNSGKFEFDI